MENLRQIPEINHNISRAPASAIRAFHKLVFEEEGDRKNRHRLRNFSGFGFAEKSQDFTLKIRWITEHLSIGDLTVVCNLLRIDHDGTMEQLATRICQHLININLLNETEEAEEEEENDEEENDSEENDEEENDAEENEEKNDATSENVRVETSTQKFMMSFRDVEDTIRTFDGGNDHAIEVWVSDFEETAKLLGWNEIQKLLFAKKSLTGLAKLFILSECGLNSWKKLKSCLLEEFSTKVNSADLHRKLFQRRMRRDETVQEYFLAMKELARRGKIEDDALFQYVIDGINDDPNRKNMLYGAQNLKEFKRKLEDYSKAKERSSTGKPGFTHAVSTSKNPVMIKQSKLLHNKSESRCFNCNETGHMLSACPKPRRAPGSCYVCGEKDHQKKNCPKRGSFEKPVSSKQTVGTTNFVESYNIPYTIQVNLDIGSTIAVLDTGSPISMLNENFLPKHVLIEPYSETSKFQGVNKSKINILGRLTQEIIVQDNVKNIGDNIKVLVNFYVVTSGTIDHNCLLGRDFVADENLKIDFGKTATICKREQICNLDTETADILHINLCENNDTKTNCDIINVNKGLEWSVQQKVRELVQDYQAADKLTEPETRLEMEIILKPHHQPFYFKPRRLSYYEKEAVTSILKDLTDRKIIQPSTSPYSSPIVLIRKKSGQIRMAVDYRELNKIVLRDNFPIPRIDDHLDALRDKVYFTQLDLKDAFHHVRLKQNSIPYTSFVTFAGQFEYLRLPFGLTNGPSFFMRFIHEVFRPLLNQNKILIYIDDILIATETIDENISILKEVLELLNKNCLELKFAKCSFLQTEIIYLGYCIDANGVRPSMDHVNAISDYPIPRSFRELHSFLGLISYFRKFIPIFAKVAQPLYDLLKTKTNFTWDNEKFRSFDKLKQALISEPILAIYSPIVETELHCDASSYGFSSVLLQKQKDAKFHPICYFSKRTNKAESKYHSFELEALAIVYSLERFRIYLQGLHFKIVTDCNSLKLTLERKEINPRIQRWSLILQNYDYTLEHRSNRQMQHADALSRTHSILIITENSFERNLAILQDVDLEICKVRSQLEQKENKFFELNNGLVYRKVNDKLLFYVPMTMENNVIRSSHEAVGHQGINKTCEYVSRVYWFPDMKRKIQQYIQNCLKCITYNTISNRVEGKLHCPEKGNTPFACIHIDHYGPLEKTQHRRKYIFEIIDAFTKFVRLYPTMSTSADEVIKHLENYFSTYSKPIKIVSDRGSAFTSVKFRDFVAEHGIHHVLIATATPHANGQIERINRILTPMLSKLVKTKGAWDKVLPDIEFALNNSVNRSINDTPARLLFGSHQIGRINDDLRQLLDEQQLADRNLQKIRENAAVNLQASNAYNEKYYDKRHKAPTKYAEGDFVMLKNIDVTDGINKKLIPKYKGPYIVKRVLGNDRYVVCDPEGQQLTQIPYEGVCSCENMKPWVRSECN